MYKLIRMIVVATFVVAVGFGVVAIADRGMPIPCPLAPAPDCPQTVLQPTICGGNCRYVNECYALANGWKRNECESAIGFSRHPVPQL